MIGHVGPPPGQSIEEAFWEFHADNPHIYVELVRMTRQLTSRGYDRVGIGMLFEVLRWNHALRTVSGDDFKLNNNHRSYYARLIMALERDLRGVFEIRQLHVFNQREKDEMAHEITNQDGVFSVRQPMWHGLGTVLDDYPTRAQAQALVHPWEPESEPLYRMVEALPDVFEEVPDFRLNVRSDNQAPLGVVSDTYETVTNTELWDVAEALQGGDPGAVRFETGGSLMGGKKVWVLIRMTEPLVIKGDPNGAVIPYYALQNSFDGTGAFRGQATATRIVCNNTSQMADHDAQARGTEFTFRHTRNVGERVEEARAALAGWRDSVQRWQRLQELLVDAPVTVPQVKDFITTFIPMPAAGTVSDRVRANVDEGQHKLLTILKGRTCEGVALTCYGLVAASIEYLNWARAARSDESRFKRAYLDRSTLVSDAQRIACEIAGVSL